MRLYLIVNRYSMGIQAGIQAMHVIPEMYEKYSGFRNRERNNLKEWANCHKTIMVLRTFGGHDSVSDLFDALLPITNKLGLPIDIFFEPELQDTATAVGIVVPTEYYDVPVEEQSQDMFDLHTLLDKFPFAH